MSIDSCQVGILDFGQNARLFLFENIRKRWFLGVKKNARAKSPVIQNPHLTRIAHGSPIQSIWRITVRS